LIELEGGLTLSPPGPDDAEELFRLIDRNREHLDHWLPWVRMNREIGDSLEFITRCEAAFVKEDGIQWGIRWQGQLAGIVGTHVLRKDRVWCSIGYWLGAEFEGKGIMTRSVRQLAGHLFEDWGFGRVEIRCEPDNVRSRAIPVRLGFVEEGTLRQNGEIHGRVHDTVVYGKLRAEW